MKRKFNILVIILFFFLPNIFSQISSPLPPVSQVSRIDISIPGGWMIRVNSDGSGLICFTATDVAPISPKTLSLTDIYNSLTPNISTNIPLKKSVTIALMGNGLSNQGYYLENKKLIVPILTQARFGITSANNPRIIELLAKGIPFLSN